MKEQFLTNDQKIEDQIKKLEAIYTDSNQEAIKNIKIELEEKKQAFEQIERSLKKVEVEAKHVQQQIKIFEKCSSLSEESSKINASFKEEEKQGGLD